MEFYTAFEKAVEERKVPQLHSTRVEHKESGLASANREYLRMHRGKHAFDICAAPFGKGFFVSWWLWVPPLRFGFLYLLAVCFGLFILTWIMWGIGLAMGASMSGAAFGFLLGNVAVFFGMPALLWCIGSGLRSGAIAGESTVLAIPILGRIYEWIFAPTTFYSLDTAIMFEKSVHRAVLEIIDCMTTAKGVRALTDDERKPVMKHFTAGA